MSLRRLRDRDDDIFFCECVRIKRCMRKVSHLDIIVQFLLVHYALETNIKEILLYQFLRAYLKTIFKSLSIGLSENNRTVTLM